MSSVSESIDPEAASAAPALRRMSDAAVRRILPAAALLCAIATLPVAWATRHAVSTDGLCYIEMAHDALRSPFRALLTNAYWSPGYPALLAAVFKFAGGERNTELALAHETQWFIAAAVYVAFAFLLYNLFRWVREANPAAFDSIPAFIGLTAFACAIVLMANVDPYLWDVYPDMLLEALVYLAAALCVRLSLPRPRLWHYAALGFVLAAGYMVKAALFPLAFILFGILIVWPVARQFRWKGPALAAAVFLLAASPLIVSLSLVKSRVTFGDVGRINYVWLVNGVSRYSLFDSAGIAWPGFLHHPARVADAPPVFFLGGAIRGTMPIWFDPSWWHEGIRPHFALREQLHTMLGNLGAGWPRLTDGTTIRAALEPWIPAMAALLACAAVLRFPANAKKLSDHAWLVLWPAAALAMFALVVIQTRYLVPFLVLAWVGPGVAAYLLNPRSSGAALLAGAFCLLLLGWPEMIRPSPTKIPGNAYVDAAGAAAKMRDLGIRDGDQLATVGSAYIPACYYCARLAGARFTFAIFAPPDAAEKLPAPEVRHVLDALRAHGARAILSAGRPGFANDSGWIALGRDAYIRLLP